MQSTGHIWTQCHRAFAFGVFLTLHDVELVGPAIEAAELVGAAFDSCRASGTQPLPSTTVHSYLSVLPAQGLPTKPKNRKQ